MSGSAERLRADLHRWVDEVVDARPVVERMASEMGAGYRGSELGTRGGSVEGGWTATLAVANIDAPHFDPALGARDWLAEWTEAVAHLRVLATKAAQLTPMSDWLAQHRTNDDAGLCTGCKLPVISERDPATGQPTRSLDKLGRPWHPTCMPDDIDRCVQCGELAIETEIVRVRGEFGGIVHARELGTGCFWKRQNELRGRRPSRGEIARNESAGHDGD